MKTPMDKLTLLRVEASGDVVSFRESGNLWASVELQTRQASFPRWEWGCGR